MKPHKAWNVDFYVEEYRLHLVSSKTFLFSKFSLIGRASEHTRQRKVLILFETLSFQMQDQKIFYLEFSELDGIPLSSSSHSSWHLVLTEYSPFLHRCQITQSTCLDTHTGITFIRWASKQRKCWSITELFHKPESKFIMQSTVASSKARTRGDKIVVVLVPGIHLSS